MGIDVKDFLAELPSLKADVATGKGAWVRAVPRRLVIGACGVVGRCVRPSVPCVESTTDPDSQT